MWGRPIRLCEILQTKKLEQGENTLLGFWVHRVGITVNDSSSPDDVFQVGGGEETEAQQLFHWNSLYYIQM